MSYEYFIAKKLIFFKDKSFTRTILKIAIASTAISLAVMILSSCIINGFSREIHKKVFGFWGHIHISNTNLARDYDLTPLSTSAPYIDEIRNLARVEFKEINGETTSDDEASFKTTRGGVRHVHPFILMPGLIETKDAFQAVLVKGVNADYDWIGMGEYLIDGALIDSSGTENQTMISQNMADKLRLSAGDDIVLSFIKDRSKIKRRVRISGVYHTGLEEYDRRLILCNMNMLQGVLDWSPDEAAGIEVVVDYPEDMKIISDYLYENVIPLDLFSETIQDKFPSIFEWLKFQDMNETLIYQLMVIVALINMMTVILIMVLEKINFIGIMKSLGANNASLKKVFVLAGGYVLLLGLIIGNIIGIGLALLQRHFGLIKLDEESYYLDTAPIYMDWMNILLINSITALIIMVALFLPLMVVSRISPIRIFRFS